MTVFLSSETSQLFAMPGRRRQVLRAEVDQQVPVHRPDVVVLLVLADERVQRLRDPAPSRSAGCSRPSSELSWAAAGDRERDHRAGDGERERRAPPVRLIDRLAASRHFERLRVGVELHPGAERHRRHVLAVAERDVGDRRDPERARSARRASPRSTGSTPSPRAAVWPRRLTSVPKTKPATLSSLPARIRWLSAVSIRYSSVFRSSTISTQPSVSTSKGVPMLGAQQGQAAADQRRLGGSARRP